PRPLTSQCFPYTTLFRSDSPRTQCPGTAEAESEAPGADARRGIRTCFSRYNLRVTAFLGGFRASIKGIFSRLASSGGQDFPPGRSEEHTSELQSRENLVC